LINLPPQDFELGIGGYNGLCRELQDSRHVDKTSNILDAATSLIQFDVRNVGSVLIATYVKSVPRR
jgi:hypothetical protein